MSDLNSRPHVLNVLMNHAPSRARQELPGQGLHFRPNPLAFENTHDFPFQSGYPVPILSHSSIDPHIKTPFHHVRHVVPLRILRRACW
jgi:hypothetical protein